MIEDNLKKLSIAKNNLNVDIIIEVPEGKRFQNKHGMKDLELLMVFQY